MQRIGLVPLTNAEKQRRYRERHPDRVNTLTAKGREGARRRTRAYEARNPGRSKDRNAKFRATPKGAATYLYWNAKRRAKVSGLEFSLTMEWIQKAVDVGVCQVTGLPFTFDNGRKPWAPSLDKTDPLGGYTPDNVKVVVWMYNTCKWCFAHEDILTFSRAILRSTSCNS